MSKEFKKGDKVTWQSHGSTAEGKVEKKITSDSKEAGRQVRAPPMSRRSTRSAATRAAVTPCTNPMR
jgi:Hypervirulence associated proteins TUDOR domain